MINGFHRNIGTANRTIKDFNYLVEKSDKANINQDVSENLWGNNIIKHSDGLYYSFIEKWSNQDGFYGYYHLHIHHPMVSIRLPYKGFLPICLKCV